MSYQNYHANTDVNSTVMNDGYSGRKLLVNEADLVNSISRISLASLASGSQSGGSSYAFGGDQSYRSQGSPQLSIESLKQAKYRQIEKMASKHSKKL